MANTKISQLTALSNPTGSEEFVYAFNNANGKVTLNTMKTFVQPDLSGYQEELVNQVNIKSINNQSLLGSGNIDISGGGGGGDGQVIYDAIVDASGQGDYSTLGTALTAGKKSIYIKNGTYTESAVTVTDNDFFVQGESEGGVILNYQTTSSDPYCIKFTTSSKTAITDHIYNTIKNVTINVDMQSGTSGTAVVDASTKSNKPYYNLYIEGCNINATNNSSGDPLFRLFSVSGANLGSGNNGSGRAVASNCLVTIQNGTGLTVNASFYDDSSNNDPKRCLIEKSKIYILSNGGSQARFINEGGSRFEDCEMLISAGISGGSSGGQTTIMGYNMYNCVIDGYANTTSGGTGEISDCKGCIINLTNFCLIDNSGIQGTTEVKDWASSTAYSVGDYVRNGSYIYKCKTAHTSGDNFDYDKFTVISMFRLYQNITGCKISVSGGYISTQATSNIVSNIMTCGMAVVIGDKGVVSGNILNSANVLKLVGKGQVVSNNVLPSMGDTTLGHGIYYKDNYNVIKDNVLLSNTATTPTSNVVGTTTNTSKVSDNILSTN